MQLEDFNLDRFKTQYQWPDLIEELSQVDVFKDVKAQDIKDILATGKLLSLESNEYLIKQNDSDNEMYILLFGHLLITQKDKNTETYLAEISPINSVGEMAFFTNNPRMANVIAIRDSILIQLHQKEILANPKFLTFITNIARIATNRFSKQTIIESFYKRSIKTITLIPAGDFKDIDGFADQFLKALSHYGNVYFKNHTEDKKNQSRYEVISRLHQEESEFDFILNVAASEMSESVKNIINHTDHLVFVASETNHTNLNPVEGYIFREKKYLHKKEFVLIRTHIDDASKVLQKWLSIREVNGYFNILNTNADFERLARMLIGKSYCLVLSGGGAKGLAHVGTIKALLEKKIPIDMIGGTSIGGLISAAFARYRNFDDIYAMAALMSQIKYRSYTLPLVSIYTGKESTTSIKRVCGEDTYIENLFLRFFSVACNLSHVTLEVSTRGLLWEAVRKTISIPAVLPPIVNPEGEIIVDGCILNNLPVDIMRRMNNGGKVIASQIIQQSSNKKYDPCQGILSGTGAMWNKLNPFAKKMNLPKINVVFAKSILISSKEHQMHMAREADLCINHVGGKFGLFAFESYAQIIDAGYEDTLKQLESLDLESLGS